MRLEWVSSCLESSCGSCCPGRRPGPSPPLVHKALLPSAYWPLLSLADLCLALSLHLFFGPQPDGPHLWQAFSGCLVSHSRSRGAKPCLPLLPVRVTHEGVPELGPVGPHSITGDPGEEAVQAWHLQVGDGSRSSGREDVQWLGPSQGRGLAAGGPLGLVNGEGTRRWLCQAWLHALHSSAGSRLLASLGGGGWAERVLDVDPAPSPSLINLSHFTPAPSGGSDTGLCVQPPLLPSSPSLMLTPGYTV